MLFFHVVIALICQSIPSIHAALALHLKGDPVDVQPTVQDIQSSGESFALPSGVIGRARLALVEGDFALLAARDAVYNISLSTFASSTAVDWSADSSAANQCIRKGKTKEQCHNYVRLVTRVKGGWLVCGTNAFDPHCRIYERAADGYLVESSAFDGTGVVPYDGEQRSAHAIVGSDVYTGGTSDFNGIHSLLHRRDTRRPRSLGLSTRKASLTKASFVGSIQSRDHVYMVLNEVSSSPSCPNSISRSSSSKTMSPRARIARVCKNDMGGSGNGKAQWTSFVKARLNCSLPGEYPFYFDDVQSITQPMGGLYFGEDAASIVYVTFNTPYAGLRASAVCAFSMDDLAHVFSNSAFKDARSRQPNERPSQCVANSRSLSEEALAFAEGHNLLQRQVPNFFQLPLLVHTDPSNGRFTQIAVDAQVVAVGGTRYDVLFIGTDNGRVLKVVNTVRWRDQTEDRSQIVETLQVLPKGSAVTGLSIHEGTKLLVVWDGGARYIDVQRCSRAPSCTSCTALRDPHCAWSVPDQQCVSHTGDRWSRSDVIQSVLSGRAAACSQSTVLVNNLDGSEHTMRLHDMGEVVDNNVEADGAVQYMQGEEGRNLPARSVDASHCGENQHSTVALASSTGVALLLGTLLGAIIALISLRCLHRRRKCTSPTHASINTSHTSMWSSTSPKMVTLSRSNSRAMPIHAYAPDPQLYSGTIARRPSQHMPSLPLEIEQRLGNVSHDVLPVDDDLEDNSNYSTLPKDYKVKQMYL